MNFNVWRFFYQMTSFIIGSFFFIIGAFSLILPWSSFLQQAATRFIVENTLALSLFGLAFILIGLSIVIYAILNTRHRYVGIRTGKNAISLDENVIRQYLEAYWQEHFPHSQIPFTLNLKKHSIQIIADLPPLPFPEQKIFLEKVKNDFVDLFGRHLGYPHDVRLFASFEKETSMSTR